MIARRSNKTLETNSRPTSPLDAGRELESASSGPPSPSAAVAHLFRSAKSSNANGVPSRSPGLSRSAYPGFAVMTSPSTPTGLRALEGCDVGETPLGFNGIGNGEPRVAARPSWQPRAGGQNAFSVRGGRCRLRWPSLNQARQPMPVGRSDCIRARLARHGGALRSPKGACSRRWLPSAILPP